MYRRLLLLGLLRREDMHGYRLNEFIERDMAFCTDIKKPTAYYLLDKLAEEGYLSEVEETSDEGRPPRKTYHITAQGKQYFQELLRETLRSYDPVTFPVDMSIAFLDELPGDEALALLEERRHRVQAQLDEVRAAPEHGGSLRYVIEHHTQYLETELSWLQSVMDEIAAQQENGKGQTNHE